MRIFLFIGIILCLTYTQFDAQTFSASNFTLIGKIDPETGFNTGGDKYSGCWGWYQASKKKEYAIACGQAGTYFVDVTAPATPTVSDYAPGVKTACTWREAKTYKNYCYVVSDDFGNNTLQIFDMQYLPDSVHKVYDSKTLFQRGHALWVDSNRLYVSSVTYSTNTYKSMCVYSLANPANPVLLRCLSDDYPFISGVHDCFVKNDTVFASCGYQGLYIFKLNSNNTFTQLGSLTTYTGSGYNHSTALTPNRKTLVMLDEVPPALPIKMVDVTNLSNMNVLATTNQFPQTTPHNPFIVNNQYCFVSSYEDGIQLFDISNPNAPFLAGYYDTYPTSGGNTGTWTNNYAGQWGCYPFFPSRNIFALDQSFGIFMLKTHLYKTNDNLVGINEDAATDRIGLFPNPASKTLSFNVPVDLASTDIQAQIFDVNGKLMYTANSSNLLKYGSTYFQMDVASLPDGVYMVQVLSGNSILATKKLVIQKQ